MKKLMIFMSYVLVAALASAVSFAAAANVPREDNAKLDELRALVDEKFIGEIDWAAAEDSAAAGMVAGLGDRWSYYMSAERYDSYLEQMNNAYVGVGITVRASPRR